MFILIVTVGLWFSLAVALSLSSWSAISKAWILWFLTAGTCFLIQQILERVKTISDEVGMNVLMVAGVIALCVLMNLVRRLSKAERAARQTKRINQPAVPPQKTGPLTEQQLTNRWLSFISLQNTLRSRDWWK